MAKLAIDQIDASAAVQVRVRVDPKVVDEYAEAIEGGAIFPVLVVFAKPKSDTYLLADGFHRLAAAVQLGRGTIGVEVKEGGVHEALAYALSANAEHGLRRTSADKSHAVQMALKDPIFSKLSLREVGELCNVSHETVRRIKESQSGTNDKVTPRPRKLPPTQNEVDRKEFLGAIATIKSFPFDGDSAWHRLELVGNYDDLVYLFDWINAAMDEHKAQEDGPDE